MKKEARSRRQLAVALGGLTWFTTLFAPPSAKANNSVSNTSKTAKPSSKTLLLAQGSTFAANFIDQCRVDAKKTSGINIVYQPSGSGAGRNGFLSNTVDLAVSDVPFSAEEGRKARPFVYIPIVSGAIALMYNIPGVTNLALNGPTIAKIFAGKITSWSDPSIASTNPGVRIPSTVIKVVVRSDSSGSSNVFSSYLHAMSPADFPKNAINTFPAPRDNGIAQKGSDGVADYVASSLGKGAITYAELSFANERKLEVAMVVNHAGNRVSPTSAGVQATLAASRLEPKNTVSINYATTARNAYPIATVTYAISANIINEKKRGILTQFLKYMVNDCQHRAEELGYAPLPIPIVAAANRTIMVIQSAK